LPGDAPKRPVRWVCLRVVQVGSVRKVERLRPELYARAGRRAKGLEERDVPVLRVGSAYAITSRVAELAGGRPGERRGIEPEHLIEGRPQGESRTGNGGVADEIPRLIGCISHARAVVVEPDRQRLPGLEDRCTRYLPIAQDLFAQVTPAAPERQLVDVVKVEQVGAIVVRECPECTRIVRVEHQVPLT